MKNNILNSNKAAIVALLLFLVLSVAYMFPALSGKNISQHDIIQHKGQSKELVDYRNETGEEAIWTNSMFGGMPGYMISTKYNGNKLTKLHSFILLNKWAPVCFIFLYLLGFYLALLAFDINKWLAIGGAIAYAFSSYLVIIIVAGHNSKVMALGYLPAIIGGIHLTFRGKYLWGGLLMGLSLGMQILVVHLQITYYTLIIVLLYGLFELVWAFKEKRIKDFSISIGVLVIAALLAVGSNMGNLLTTVEYGKYSIRGKSELSTNAENKTSGLDRDYATAWSYGKMESFTLLVPNFYGGASGGELPQDSETYRFLSKVQGKAEAKKAIKRMPTYWGDQPGTSGPVYVGAIICFLFVLGLFIVDKKLRWWLLTATIVSLLLAWGKNIPNLTNFLLDNLPGYNKFRAVSMTLVIAGFTMPLLAILAFNRIIKKEITKPELLKALKYSLGVVGGLLLIFLLFGKAMFDFEAPSDQNYLAQGYTDFVDALQADRAMLFKRDAFRSLLFVLLTASVIYLFIIEKIKALQAVIILGVLILLDIWPVAKRYLNDSHFVSEKKYENPFTPSAANQFILSDPDPNYRVLNLGSDVFNDASTSYYHKSIGGYHGAKMRRYQELIEHNIQIEIQNIVTALRSGDFNNIDNALAGNEVVNMLNTKYIIYNPEAQPLVNRSANGNAWLVNDYTIVENADEEIARLKTLNTKTEALVDVRFGRHLENKTFTHDSLASIELIEYQPNYLKYSTSASTEQLAVFSEIYYPEGWEVTIDGVEASHFRANYVLRAMVIPEGEHSIEFNFHPKTYFKGEKISLASSLILLLLLVGMIGWEVKKGVNKKKKEN
jgi:hypothetical protein